MLGKVAVVIAVGAVSCLAADAQEFDAASVKLSGPQSVRMSNGGPGSRDPERYTYNRAFMRDLLFEAFGLTDYREQIDGPGWIDTESYDVAVKIPSGATKEEFRKMLQNLLAERFKLAAHHESTVLPVYDLVVAKNGPKFTAEGPAADGFPSIPAGRPGLSANYSAGPNGQSQSRWRAQQETMDVFARMLSGPGNAGRIVVDKTGLTGKYDFTLFFEIPRPGASATDAAESPTLSIFDALEQQLGLKLVDARQSFDKIVIDHAERIPSEN